MNLYPNMKEFNIFTKKTEFGINKQIQILMEKTNFLKLIGNGSSWKLALYLYFHRKSIVESLICAIEICSCP